MRSCCGACTSRLAGAVAAAARRQRNLGGTAGCESRCDHPLPCPSFSGVPVIRGPWRLPLAPCETKLPRELPPAYFFASASGLAGRSGGLSAWACLAAGGCPPVTGLLLPSSGPATVICFGCGFRGVGLVVLGVDDSVLEGWVGVLAEGAGFGSRGGSMEASGVVSGGGEIVGGAGLWGWGGVVAALVGTAEAVRGGSLSVLWPEDSRTPY